MKNLLLVIAVMVALVGCHYEPPRHTVKVYIVEAETAATVTATDKDDVACKGYGFCGDYAYRLETPRHVCYGPDYRVDVMADPLKRCYVPYSR